jgi:2-polyprenyl-3-methyl-5-hydroxy-6-metoxy-1,4-benzoquinol methylase
MPFYCPICNFPSSIILRKYKSESSILSKINLSKCNKCELVFASPMPTIDMWEQYNSDYFNVAHGGITNNINTINFFKGIAVVRMKYILNYTNKNSIILNSILEIGPGVGYLAEKWLKFFPNLKYSVVETDTSCHSSLNKIGINVYNNIEDVPETSIFDLVIHSHVLEHVINPVEFLKNNTFFLRHGGVLFIDVPCNDWKFKELDEPHLLFFDKKPMLYLLNEQLNHRNIQISYHGNEINNILKKSNFRFLRKIIFKFKMVFKIVNWVILDDKKYLTFNEYLMISDFKPQMTNKSESWWLRSISIK